LVLENYSKIELRQISFIIFESSRTTRTVRVKISNNCSFINTSTQKMEDEI
jgi:hypothetical protein